MREQAKALAERGRAKLAIRTLQKALELYPRYPLAMNDLAVLLASDDELMRARALLEQALELKPDLGSAWANLGEIRRRQGQRADARKAYERAAELRPNDPDVHYGLAAIHQESGDKVAALAAMERFLQVQRDPDDPRTKEVASRAAALIKDGVTAGAPTAVATTKPTTKPDEPQTTEPGEPGPLEAHRGDDAFYRERFGEALAAYRTALKEAPRDVTLLYKLGATHAVMNDYRAALRVWGYALGLDPTRELLVRHIGLAARRLAERGELQLATDASDAVATARAALLGGEPEAAMQALVRSGDREAVYLRAEAALQLGRLRYAKKAFEQRLSWDAKDQAALGGLAEVLVRQMAGVKALDALRRWLGKRSTVPEEFLVMRRAEALARIANGPGARFDEDEL